MSPQVHPRRQLEVRRHRDHEPEGERAEHAAVQAIRGWRGDLELYGHDPAEGWGQKGSGFALGLMVPLDLNWNEELFYIDDISGTCLLI